MLEILQEMLKMDSFLVKFGDCTQVYEESSQTSVMEIYSYHVPSLMFSRVINKPQLPQQLNWKVKLKGFFAANEYYWWWHTSICFSENYSCNNISLFFLSGFYPNENNCFHHWCFNMYHLSIVGTHLYHKNQVWRNFEKNPRILFKFHV